VAVKIAVFLDLYEPLHHTKDGNVLMGLLECSASPTLVTACKPELQDYSPPFPVIQASIESFTDPHFWQDVDADLVLAYTWLNKNYNATIRSIKQAGKLLMIRADRDGRIGHPLIPRAHYSHSVLTATGLRNLARRAASRVLGKHLASGLLQQFILADAIYIESLDARANLAHWLGYWNRPDLMSKVHHIPVAVCDEFITAEIPKKERQVVAVGRWDDWRVKNTKVAIRVLSRLLATRPSFRVAMLGPGEELIRRALAEAFSSPSSRFSIMGARPQQDVVRTLGESMALFMPSRWEGFPLAAAEAVCMGCTVTGSPIEALRSLARDGDSGTIASDFDENTLFEALLRDTEKWESGEYDPEALARMWREEFDRRRVADRILTLARGVMGKPG
jgi:glycosyltransferase involved in cell wall biosynthesis